MNIHIKTAWDRIRRSPFQALAALFVLSITFFVITFLVVVVYSSNQVIKFFETRPQIIAFLRDEATSETILSLQKKLEEDARTKKVVYVSKEEALEIYKKATSDNPLLAELVSPSIFPASLEVSLSDIKYAKDLIGEIKKEEIVEQVSITASLGGEDSLDDVVNRLKRVTMYLRVGGGIFASILTLASFLTLVIIISMRITTRKEEIEILRLIGATPGFIKSPIILETLMYSFSGVFTGWLATLVLVLYSTPSLISYFGEIPILPKDAFELLSIFGLIILSELVAGFFLALAGSFLAVSRIRR